VLAVVASSLDPAARDLVAAWSGAGAVLISAQDLSVDGWSFRVGDPGGGTAVVDSRRVPVSDLRAVLTRRPAVVAEELAWIDPADRTYLAAEMNAFLVAWLHALPCTVVNRPTPTSLAGPVWGPLHWAAAAARADVRWVTDTGGATHDVVVCGQICVGAATPTEAAASRLLARAAGVELLGVRFSARGACAATPSPRLEDDDVRQALLRHLVAGPR
jgi:hypothetical protein